MNFFKKILTVVLCIAAFTACKKDNTTSAPAKAGFTWHENDPNGTENYTENCQLNKGDQTIFAYTLNQNGGASVLFNITLPSITVGSHDLAEPGVSFYFRGMRPNAATGAINIKSIDMNTRKASGTIEAHTVGAQVHSVYGTFTDILVNQ
ncbi:MAG: hypothetical protein H6553_03220 [Chitinophagales bacterium]|nr:hypothetical protein [Chitinophagales bacterium]